ncbi:MAG TPA: polymer-forming cytoskeletal protein [Thermodesulfovibrionales bacterium]|nr:polymer-forming cytoskeletal protein [Thermodesulfovibrionales bacterium]
MFSKNTEKLESLVGVNSQFRGDIKSKGTVRIDGSVEGNVEADWIVLGEKANLRGNATARGIITGGIIEGNVIAREILEIKSKGQVIGDITSARLIVSEGGMLEGRSFMQKSDAKVLELPMKERAGNR